MNMEKAIKIVEEFIAKVNENLMKDAESYGRTKADNIFDAHYRKMLEEFHDRNLTRLTLLDDLKRELEKAVMDEEAKS